MYKFVEDGFNNYIYKINQEVESTDGLNEMQLQARKDYSFLCAQVFRLSLIRNINFISMLKDIKNKKILDRTLEMYPMKFQEIMKPIFDYSKDVLMNQAIEDSDSKIYTKQRK